MPLHSLKKAWVQHAAGVHRQSAPRICQSRGQRTRCRPSLARAGAGAAFPPLFCVPILAKDNYDVQGTPTTAGAQAFADNYPLQDSTMVRWPNRWVVSPPSRPLCMCSRRPAEPLPSCCPLTCPATLSSQE